jgi:hypothetical protein
MHILTLHSSQIVRVYKHEQNNVYEKKTNQISSNRRQQNFTNC